MIKNVAFSLVLTVKRMRPYFQSHHRSVVQIWLRQPSVAETKCLAITDVEVKTWMTLIVRYLEHDTCKLEEEKAMKQQCSRYTMLNQDLYCRGYSRSLLKCITEDQVEYVLKEIHEGICDSHSGARTMVAKVLRAGYYQPTVQGDCAEFVKKCAKCQEFGSLHHLKSEALHSMTSPWSFAIWGMDIVGPFVRGKGQRKFLLIGVDYFTKWIEAERLASISTKNVQNLVQRSIVCWFGMPHKIVTDNGRQFINRGLQSFYKDLDIKSITTLVEHPQTNGQAKTANMVILNELKKRLGKEKGRWTEELLEVL